MEDALEYMELDLPQDNDMSTSLRLVKRYVNETLASALDELSTPDGRPTITLKRRSRNVSLFISPTSRALESNGADTYITYSWPGANAFEAWKFSIYIILLATLPRVLVLIVMTIAIVFRVLAVVADAIDTGLLVSKRDIYYSDPVCFGTQKVVDAIIDDLAYTIGVDRSALNIEAAAKGLVTGYCSLLTKYGETMDLRLPDKDCLVPSSQDNGEIDISDASWVLIIEKEAIYRRLARSNYHTRAAAGRGILITGKGYPDLSTRAFLRKIYDKSRRSDKILPFYGLVDSDPDGMAIMSTYKYGSMAHTNQNGRLNIPCLCWLGLRTSDVVSGAPSNDDGALIRLTARDRKKIMTMLSNSPVWAAEGPELEWRAELQQMLMLNLKAEIEILYDWDGGLEGWIDQKMAGFSPSDN